MSKPKLPAFESLLKSRDVEDPINLWLHRPLAYGFVALVYGSKITPNQITALATLVGLAAGVCFFVGSSSLMVWGGALLWASAILDGADGILARAQRSGSPLGRAIDGTADALVAFVTVMPAFYHIWVQRHDALLLALGPLVLVLSIVHVYFYDFYKESYLQMTDPHWSGRPERVAEVEAQAVRIKGERAGLVDFIASRMYADLLRIQTRVIALIDPDASREPWNFKAGETTAEIYRRYNRGPIKLWSTISLAPHSYLMAICAMFDRLDLYLWFRLVVCNAVFLGALLWQRSASRRTRQALLALGLAPVPVHS